MLSDAEIWDLKLKSAFRYHFIPVLTKKHISNVMSKLLTSFMTSKNLSTSRKSDFSLDMKGFGQVNYKSLRKSGRLTLRINDSSI